MSDFTFKHGSEIWVLIDFRDKNMGWTYNGKNLLQLVFSWSLQYILDKDRYRQKVNRIPKTFSSVGHYMNSFIFPLIEETRFDLCSSMTILSTAPASEIECIKPSDDFKAPDNLIYDVVINKITNDENEVEIYEPENGDLIALTNVRPKCIDDLNWPKGSCVFALVQKVRIKFIDDDYYHDIQILSSKPIESEQDVQKFERRRTLFTVFLSNMTTNMRIWKALNSELCGRNMNILKQVLQTNSSVVENYAQCFSQERYSVDVSTLGAIIRSFDLNDSQEEAVLSCIAMRECYHRNTVKLIWGPPGTGKTKTVGSLVFALLKSKCKTLTCAPTNVAVLEVTTRLLNLVMPTLQHQTYGLGDVILFGNGERMKIDNRDDLLDVFLDYRADVLAKSLAPLSGWNHCLELMICLLEDPDKQYYEKQERYALSERFDAEILTLDDFWKQAFNDCKDKIKMHVVSMYTHLPTSIISLRIVKKMIESLELLELLETLLAGVSQGLKHALSDITDETNRMGSFTEQSRLSVTAKDCLKLLKSLCDTFILPDCFQKHEIKSFCLKSARLIFCTVSSAAKLHAEEISRLEILIIDEAAQLKECESIIPLLLPGIHHAVLIGDERQLPSLVRSKRNDLWRYHRLRLSRSLSGQRTDAQAGSK
ncbi:helicase sen1-like [Jatropha curcas]|uniref:helicase sen1-like n=1 Tax=Jatropha curcas TaxID=180498 RepID=UPI00189455DD|nr:helicase sen1-like [Jatropha curcas]